MLLTVLQSVQSACMHIHAVHRTPAGSSLLLYLCTIHLAIHHHFLQPLKQYVAAKDSMMLHK